MSGNHNLGVRTVFVTIRAQGSVLGLRLQHNQSLNEKERFGDEK